MSHVIIDRYSTQFDYRYIVILTARFPAILDYRYDSNGALSRRNRGDSEHGRVGEPAVLQPRAQQDPRDLQLPRQQHGARGAQPCW